MELKHELSLVELIFLAEHSDLMPVRNLFSM